MNALLKFARLIDTMTEAIGKTVGWLILVAVIICATNALMRYTFSMSSNAWLEIQWYLFAAVFMLAAAYTLRKNEHVRIDVITGHFSPRAQAWIDILGSLFFLLPLCLLMLDFSIPYALKSMQSQEMSQNAGGLIVWPARLLIPTGFALLTLQACSELIKRIAFLLGMIDSKEFEKGSQSAEDEIIAIAKANQLDVPETDLNITKD